jgi:membrane associated rhomboid family serine protease
MLPLHDVNPTRRFPLITYALIGINVVVFVLQLGMSERELTQVFMTQSVVPREASAAPFSLETILDVIRSMFFHGGWAHILGNMLYLWLFGDNVEDRFGEILYIAVYLISGFVAAFAQILIDPTSSIPLVGASGAIAGVLGSYLVLYPSVRVRGIIPLGFFSQWVEWPAWIVLGMWFVLQLFNGFASLGAAAQYGGGVAFFAHIGGFVAGVVITFLFMRVVPQPPVEDRQQALYDRARRYWK